MGAGAAARVAGAVGAFLDGPLPVRIRAWDGSEAGAAPDPGVPTVVLRSRRALRRLLWQPGEMGLAHAYVSGDLDVDGDLAEGLAAMWALVRTGVIAARRPGVGELPGLAAQALRLGLVGPKPAAPPEAIKVRGRRHSRRRDRDVIAHHYDAGNAFYALLLDDSMAYSSGYWTSTDPSYGVADAQRDKLDLVCRKLGLDRAAPGHRHLDIGCGWGSLSLHAAAEYGVSVVGVTISTEQKAYIDERLVREGLQDRVDIRLQDYREVADGPFDTVSSIEMGEHVGKRNYPVFLAQIERLLNPGGRMLIQQMSRTTKPGGGPFIEAFIAPDMHMRPVGETVALIEKAGLEVRDVHALREHYVRTVDAWYATFESHWDEVVAMVGEEMARVWRLYLVGGALAFEEGRMGVDQILAVKSTADGRSGLPPVRTW
jgi:cyclopropane-fatty-acyl-phospholipid synthase